MAQKRMFSQQIVETDRFVEMPPTTQLLYFHLGMFGDDDGFVSSPKRIARSTGCTDDDLRLLIAKKFIIPFESGVVVISDWNINNTLKNDRYKPTIYENEKKMLQKTTKNAYISETVLEPIWNQSGTNLEPQHNVTQPNGTKRNGKEGTAAKPPTHTPAKRSFSKYGWVKLTDEEYNRLLSDLGEQELTRCIAYIDEAAESTGNKNKWKNWNLVIRRCARDGWGKGWTGKQQKNGGFLDESFYMTEESAKDSFDFAAYLFDDVQTAREREEKNKKQEATA